MPLLHKSLVGEEIRRPAAQWIICYVPQISKTEKKLYRMMKGNGTEYKDSETG